MDRILSGALSGATATVPMTVWMISLHRKLPVQQRYPLPPREITEALLEETGANPSLNERERLAATIGGHFLYGAGCGVIYTLTVDRFGKGASVSKGALFGALIWAGSYLGWLPAARLLKPATQHPVRRSLLMISAHLIWGGCMCFVHSFLFRRVRLPLSSGVR